MSAALTAAGEAHYDAAVLDINLGGEMSYAVADCLAERGIPFLLATGYDDWALPPRLAGVPRLAKPFSPRAALDAIVRMTAETQESA